MRTVTKLFTTKATSIDDETKSVDFVISTNDVDRYGDVVDQKSWDFKSYQDNPIVLWGHDPSEPENVLGTASNLRIDPSGSNTKATLSFATDANPKAALVWALIKKGVLRTVSVGFRNHSLEYDEDTPILKDNELLEVSVVPIPANAGAVAKELKAGTIHAKDAKFLMDSMRKEADLMEDTLKDVPNDTEKSMTPEQVTAVLDGIAKLTETIGSLTEKVDAQAATIEELKATQTDPEETEAAKAARETKDAEEAEAARQAEEDAKNNPAKPGDNDQGGAGEDEFDENAEVTPEQQAEIDAAIEAELEAVSA